MSLRSIFLGSAVVGVSFFGALFAMNLLAPPAPTEGRPRLADPPPLPAATRASVVIAPTAIALTAIRDAMESAAPRNLAGNKNSQGRDGIPLIGDIGWTIDRGPLSVSNRSEALAISTNLNGVFRATGKLGAQVGGAVGGLLGGAVSTLGVSGVGRQVQDFTGKTFDQRVDLKGTVTISSRPSITPSWRIVPNLAGSVNIGDVTLPIAGFRLNVGNEVRPVVDRSVQEQIGQLEARVRNDPMIEQVARREWAKMCRSISLGAAGAGVPSLWLEIRPTKAFAAQPRVDASALNVTIGVQAETRVLPTETKPNCPFPAQLELVQRLDKGRVAIGVPIDVPFTEINKLLEAQLTGKTFPEDGSGPVDITVKRATVAASGDRLLISLLVNAKEKKSWFGFGAEATLHIWGKPTLDQASQIVRMTDLELDIESEAALGLLGAAANAARPQLRAALAEKAVIDLKPFAADVKKRVEAALADFRQQQAGFRVDAAISEVRLAGIEFDAKTLRVIAEAEGDASVTVSSLAFQ